MQTQIKENIKAQRHWPSCGEFTGDRWIPRTNGQYSIGWCHHENQNSSGILWLCVLLLSFRIQFWKFRKCPWSHRGLLTKYTIHGVVNKKKNQIMACDLFTPNHYVNKIPQFSCNKTHWKISSVKWRRFCHCLNVLIWYIDSSGFPSVVLSHPWPPLLLTIQFLGRKSIVTPREQRPSTSMRYRPDAVASGRYLIDIDLNVFAVCMVVWRDENTWLIILTPKRQPAPFIRHHQAPIRELMISLINIVEATRCIHSCRN